MGIDGDLKASFTVAEQVPQVEYEQPNELTTKSPARQGRNQKHTSKIASPKLILNASNSNHLGHNKRTTKGTKSAKDSKKPTLDPVVCKLIRANLRPIPDGLRSQKVSTPFGHVNKAHTSWSSCPSWFICFGPNGLSLAHLEFVWSLIIL